MVRKARITIDIEGVQRPYTDGHWVVLNASGFPVGFMRIDRKHLMPAEGGRAADVTRAVKDFYADDRQGFARHVAGGHRIELVGEDRFRELLDIHLGRVKERSEHPERETQ